MTKTAKGPNAKMAKHKYNETAKHIEMLKNGIDQNVEMSACQHVNNSKINNNIAKQWQDKNISTDSTLCITMYGAV